MTTKKNFTVAISVAVKATDEKIALELLDKVLKARKWDYTKIGKVTESEIVQVATKKIAKPKAIKEKGAVKKQEENKKLEPVNAFPNGIGPNTLD
jgi:hypothetical protein